MANAGATSHKTPPPNSTLSAEESGLQSNSHAVGSTVVSEHVSTVGVEVNNVHPWIAQDVQNFEKCEADAMLQELLARCTGPSQSLSASEKKTLFETSLKAVLPICNEGAVAQEIKGHLTDFCEVNKEPASYAPFVRAANCALLKLREVKVYGIPTFKDDDKTNILLHVNDPIYEDRQGAQFEHKPDVVVVSHHTAMAHKSQESQALTETACNAPKGNFRWSDIRSTLDFKRTRHPAVQNGLYVAEMFAAHAARQHVISFLVNNDYIYLWYCDRENTIQCAGINFVQDLPPLMLLLLIMQRMQYEQWGLNPVFEPEPGFSGEVMVEDAQMRIDLKLDLKSNERVTHFGICGRATTVFPVKSKALLGLRRNLHSRNNTPDMVSKLYWPEETRQSEVDILDEVYKIAQTDPDVLGHVPDLVWSHKFEGTSTSKIRIALGLKDAEQAKQGSRVLYILVFKKLLPITTLSGKEFLAAWWQIVKCHRALWKGGVRHRDISPSNLMGYRLCGQFIGVLNDYDLSLFQRDSPSGLKHTGTVPFMAANLLTTQAITGNVEHVYAHDAESFIWVLAWVCLRYEGGNLLSKNRPLQNWLKYDAIECRKAKVDFWSVRFATLRPTGSHEESWKVVRKGFIVIHSLYSLDGYLKLADQQAFEMLLENPMLEHLQGDGFLSGI